MDRPTGHFRSVHRYPTRVLISNLSFKPPSGSYNSPNFTPGWCCTRLGLCPAIAPCQPRDRCVQFSHGVWPAVTVAGARW